MTKETPVDMLEMDLSHGGGDDWQVTPHGRFLGEMLAENNLVEGSDVLELGAGLGNHTILLARQNAARILATEIHESFLDSTRKNFAKNCPDFDAIRYEVADWLTGHSKHDVIVTNPPFAKSGKQNRRYYIDSLILDGHKRLNPGGRLVFVQSSMADIGRTGRTLDQNGYDHRIVGTTQNPFRSYYFEDETFMAEIREVENGFEMRGDEYWETLFVIEATLREWSPPEGAHLPPA